MVSVFLLFMLEYDKIIRVRMQAVPETLSDGSHDVFINQTHLSGCVRPVPSF